MKIILFLLQILFWVGCAFASLATVAIIVHNVGTEIPFKLLYHIVLLGTGAGAVAAWSFIFIKILPTHIR